MADTVQAISDPEYNPVDPALRLLSAIVDSSEDAIVSKTLDGIITSWNPAAERMFGYTAPEAIGRSIRIIIPADRLGEEDFILSSIRSGKKVDHFETVRRRKDGTLIDVSLRVSPVRSSSGTITGASKIARDITDRKRIERERERLLAEERTIREQLAETIKARDDFIAIAAHELRNPLNVSALSLQLLHRVTSANPELARIQNLVEKSIGQLARLGQIVDRLMDVTRAQAGILELYREPFDLAELTREVVNRFRFENPMIPIGLNAEVPVEGHWDRLRMDQAVGNLVSNAVKYGQGQPIEVGVYREVGRATVVVRDHGPGIPPDDQKRIFERFQRANNGAAKGLGIGLWLTKHIVEAHRGELRVDSEPGHGSAFTLEVPLTR
jgi:PAS domain S-box-containing protein